MIFENKDGFYLECDCGSNEHLLKFEFDSDEKLLYISKSNSSDNTFWMKLKNVWKYLFYKEDLIFSDFIVNQESIWHITKRMCDHLVDIDDRLHSIDFTFVDDLVDEWHESDSELSLQEYLNMEDIEYGKYVKGGK